ncbi:MAG: hypothetical protein AAFW82_10690, partial [Pseudomonadota bacterium]
MTQSVSYFSQDDLEALYTVERVEELGKLSSECPISGATVELSHSHYMDQFTVSITPPGDGSDTSYLQFPSTSEEPMLAEHVNRHVNMIMAGYMAQNPKLDAKTAAWAAHDDQREAGFSDDYERFERFFIYEGFDRDVARNIAFQLAN